MPPATSSPTSRPGTAWATATTPSKSCTSTCARRTCKPANGRDEGADRPRARRGVDDVQRRARHECERGVVIQIARGAIGHLPWVPPTWRRRMPVAFIQEFKIAEGDRSTTNYDSVRDEL